MYTKEQMTRESEASRTMLFYISEALQALTLCVEWVYEERDNARARDGEDSEITGWSDNRWTAEWERDSRDAIYDCYRHTMKALRSIATLAIADPDAYEFREARARDYRGSHSHYIADQEEYRRSAPFLRRRVDVAYDRLVKKWGTDAVNALGGVIDVLCKNRLND